MFIRSMEQSSIQKQTCIHGQLIFVKYFNVTTKDRYFSVIGDGTIVHPYDVKRKPKNQNKNP